MSGDTVGALVNPASGDGRGLAMLEELSNAVGIVDTNVTTGADDIPRITRRICEQADLFAVVGGDGTVREVVAALQSIDDPPPLFVVPAGRGNSTYRHLYGDIPWEDVVRAIAVEYQTRPLEAGRVTADGDSWLFVLGFSLGIFEAGVGLAERLRLLPGKLAYVLGTTGAALSQTPFEVSIDAAGEPVFDGTASLVAIGGGRFRGSSFALLPDSIPGDETLHLLVLEPPAMRAYPRLLKLAERGEHVEHPAVTYRQATAFELATDRVGAETDGTRLGTVADVHVEVVPDALEVAYPVGEPLWDHGNHTNP